MAIRKIEMECPSIPPVESKWHHLSCELVTPLYGGGVESSTIDDKMPIRAAGIKGQLRIWWRMLAKNLWKLGSDKEIQKAEFQLWGGMGDDAHASEVFIKVSAPSVNHRELTSYKDYTGKYRELSYVFFPADNETDTSISHDLLGEGYQWQLSVKFSDALAQDDIRRKQVLETIRWWSQFGGIGARSRRGTGAFIIKESETLPELLVTVTEDEVALANCTLAIGGGQGDALTAWKNAIGKLQSFRQAPGLGRNSGQQANRPWRSRWPEPDAIRRIQKTHAPQHAPEHKAGNIFPRGLFGMPIIFHFVGRGEPGDTTLQPKGDERMASRLFIRPIYNRDNGRYSPAVLLFPYEDLFTTEVELKGSREGSVKLWDKGAADLITPVKDYGGDNPLAAFMNYFQKG